MPRPSQDVTDAELAVMQALWELPELATIRQLTDRLYPEGGSAHFSTVQKLLERLEAKGYVRRRRGESSPQHFAAAVSKEQLIGKRLHTLADKLCGGSIVPLLTQLVSSSSISERERKELRTLIDQLDRKNRQTR